MAFIPRFLTEPGQSFFLFGPRGIGKTTWLRQRLPDALFVNLLRPEVHREVAARPERLRELVRGDPARRDVVVDEVQRVPELLHVVHDLMEEPDPPRFVLTGSSARKLRRGGVNLLAGRAVVRSLHPFMAAELPDFQLDRALETGLIPLVVEAKDPAATLSAYAGLYVEQEVQAEGLVRDVGVFARFLEAISFSHGSVLNVSNVARDTQANRKTVEGYLEILEDLHLGFRVPVFTRRARRLTAAHPKFYLFDAGLFRSLRPRGPLDRPEEIGGAALEGLVAQHLRAWIAYTGADDALYCWRTRAGVEVDFVVYGPSGFWAIEVKNARDVRSADVRALRAFAEDYPESEPLLLYRGADRLEVGGVRCVPVEELLGTLQPGRAMAIDR
jgi:predicted AAA+ superfamily ATPase